MSSADFRSLVDIMGSSKLGAKPTTWTSEYLHLLGIDFDDVEWDDENSGESTPKVKPREEDNYARRLVKKAPPSSKRAAFTKLISSPGAPFSHHCDSPPLYFAGYVAHRPNYSLYKTEEPEKVGAWVGYFHHAREVPLHELSRWAFYDQFPAVTTLPKQGDDWTRHPYFVCILLSIAQAQRAHMKPKHLDFFTSRLFVTDDKDATFLHVFEATIPCRLLRMIDRPSTAMKLPAIPTIKHKRIPFKPGKMFKDRVIAEAAAPVVT